MFFCENMRKCSENSVGCGNVLTCFSYGRLTLHCVRPIGWSPSKPSKGNGALKRGERLAEDLMVSSTQTMGENVEQNLMVGDNSHHFATGEEAVQQTTSMGNIQRQKAHLDAATINPYRMLKLLDMLIY